MNRSRSPHAIWGLGLSPEENDRIGKHAGPDHKLRNWPESALPGPTEIEAANPLLIWIPWRVWKNLPQKNRRLYQGIESIQKVLLLDAGSELDELDRAYEVGFMAILKSPIKHSTVKNVLDRAHDIRSLYGDIYRMTEEIYLERELLARKNEQLSFLNRFLSRASQSLETTTILDNARRDLDMLLPVRLLQAVFWGPAGETGLQAELFLAEGPEGAVRNAWIETLLASAMKLAGHKVNSYAVTMLPPVESLNLDPKPGRIMMLPVRNGLELFGCLALLSEEEYNLGRDQVEILHSALNHLGLALKNALIYREIKTEVDFDGLTKAYTRQFFDKQLHRELERHARYNQPLSLLMIDLDHFKRVNDVYGHQAGDEVLRGAGSVLLNTVRATDMVARYGGEEFAIILPQTDRQQTMILAERLRTALSEKQFQMNGSSLRVTVSIGAATLRQDMTIHGANALDSLVREADSALYRAKAEGRNMVQYSTPFMAEAAGAVM